MHKLVLGVLAAMGTTSPLGAVTTVLTFNTGEVACASATNDGATATQACATNGSGPNGQIIGATYGSSPNLAVSYDASESTGSRTSLHFNTTGGGSATAFPTGPADELSKIFFTPAAGLEVSFRSFDWYRITATTSIDFIFRVRNPDGNIIFTGGADGGAVGSHAPNTTYFSGPLTFEFGNGGRGAAAVDNITVDVRAVANAVPDPHGRAARAAGAQLRARACQSGGAAPPHLLARDDCAANGCRSTAPRHERSARRLSRDYCWALFERGETLPSSSSTFSCRIIAFM